MVEFFCPAKGILITSLFGFSEEFLSLVDDCPRCGLEKTASACRLTILESILPCKDITYSLANL